MLQGYDTPFDILLDYAAKSRACSVELNDHESPAEMYSGVGFTLDDQTYLIAIDDLTEIINAPHFTKIPRLKSYVCGVANIRGSIVPVVDLMLFFKKTSSRIARLRRLLVIEYKETYTGLLVDDILGMQHFPTAQYQTELPKTIDTEIAPFLNGCYWRASNEQTLSEVKKELFPVFNTQLLLSNENIENLAN